MLFIMLDALIRASIALTVAYFVFLTAMSAAGRLKLFGRGLSIWLMVLAVLILIGGIVQASMRPLEMRLMNRGGRFQPYMPGYRLNPPPRWRFAPDGRSARPVQPARPVPPPATATPGSAKVS